MFSRLIFTKRATKLAILASIVALSACAKAEVTRSIVDPHEAKNRQVFANNVRSDRAVVRPVAKTYGQVVPGPIRQSVGNFASNFSLPGLIVNNILQGDIDGFGKNTSRFLFNTVFGIGGLFDPASDAGLYEDDTDFGETLYVWGVGEGNYVVLPVFGPSTERHMVGRVVDIFTNPLGNVLKSPDSYGPRAAKFASRLDDRNQFADTIDGLYDADNAYEQARLLYLQNRRFKLGSETSVDSGDDAFGELYGE